VIKVGNKLPTLQKVIKVGNKLPTLQLCDRLNTCLA
jgi:hypothetical protein